MFDWLQTAVTWLVRDVLGLPPGAPAAALDFFFYDSVKILLLLAVIIYAITFVRGFFPPERTRRFLAGRKGGLFAAHVLAAGLGIVTPFCSCSAVPLFIGFVEAGVPLGVTFSYLVSAPMINEVALGMLYGTFGWQVALLYIGSGLVIAIFSGLLIGRAKLERYVEDYVWKIKVGEGAAIVVPSWRERFTEAWSGSWAIIRKIWPWVLVGVGVGSVMHAWVPTGALASLAGPGNPFAVPLAVAVGVPLYSNAAGIIPLVGELTRAGVALGTALAFMMAVTALSLPEMILLRQVLKMRLLLIFIAVVTLGIIGTGYLFNAIL